MITINPAKQLVIEDRVGSIETGKDADLVLYKKHPLSVYAVPEMVFIDGKLYFSREKDIKRQRTIETEKRELLEIDKDKKKETD